MRRQLVTGLRVTIALLLLTCVLYPLAVWAVGAVVFKGSADGSLIKRHGTVVGSTLLGQNFLDAAGDPSPKYFQPRPSAAGAGYDGAASGGSNFGPDNPTFLKLVAERVAAYRAFNGLGPRARVPVDAVTASASGLDPDISVANAMAQAPRIAKQRGLALSAVESLVGTYTHGRQFGFLGEPGVRVLPLNLALDATHG